MTKELDSYEINKDTYAILNVGEEASQIIESNQEYLLPKKTFEVMEDSCAYYGSSLDGRLKGTRMILGSNYKLPILVEERNEIVFFPTTGTSNEKCSWISVNHILKYEPYKGYTKITFTNGKSIVLKLSTSSFEVQLLRATRLQSLIKRRVREN